MRRPRFGLKSSDAMSQLGWKGKPGSADSPRTFLPNVSTCEARVGGEPPSSACHALLLPLPDCTLQSAEGRHRCSREPVPSRGRLYPSNKTNRLQNTNVHDLRVYTCIPNYFPYSIHTPTHTYRRLMPVHNQQNKYTKERSDLLALRQVCMREIAVWHRVWHSLQAVTRGHFLQCK